MTVLLMKTRMCRRVRGLSRVLSVLAGFNRPAKTPTNCWKRWNEYPDFHSLGLAMRKVLATLVVLLGLRLSTLCQQNSSITSTVPDASGAATIFNWTFRVLVLRPAAAMRTTSSPPMATRRSHSASTAYAPSTKGPLFADDEGSARIDDFFASLSALAAVDGQAFSNLRTIFS